MTIEELFKVQSGNSFSLNRLARAHASDGIAFVSRTAQNNGVAAWVKPVPGIKPFPSGRLTVSLRSRNHALATFLQTRPFYTAYHLFVLEPRQSMTPVELLWWARCIEANRFRYNFGRQANRSLAALRIPDHAPAWLSAMTIPQIDTASRRSRDSKMPALETWRWFRLDTLFSLHRGGGVLKREANVGTTPLVSASARNNGVTAHIDARPRFPSGWITVCSNGSVGEAFVQPAPFVATADITVLQPKVAISLEALLFLCTVISHEKYRFNYGRKWPMSRISMSKIRLPAEPNGKPDYARMGTFVAGLPFSRFAGDMAP